ncbi:MAG: type II toxin-antitoxin system VapC family toxin, partial [Pseudomonadota bacterium]
MILLDASVAVKWFLPEQDRDLAMEILERDELCAPDLILNETANSLWKNWKKKVIGRADVERAMIAFADRFAELTPWHRWSRSEIARREKCLYIIQLMDGMT